MIGRLCRCLSVLSALVTLSGCNQSPAPTPTSVPAGWKLVWHDEFDGTSIDRTNWTFDLGAGGWGNNEIQYYTDRPENARVENGLLIIEARHEQYRRSDYTSARLKTQGLHSFQYGRIEARLKVPGGAGTWPAFWMLGADFGPTPWPDCGEIDIMEFIGKEPTLILGTLHGPGYSGELARTESNPQTYDIADAFHTYAVEWQPDQVSWFYDNVKYFTVTRSDLGGHRWVFDHPFFIILNLALGGEFGGPIDAETAFPLQLQVDYVRVFQPIT
jgi:beta-glucanase (GH16 family)